jgi:hypothetical protein
VDARNSQLAGSELTASEQQIEIEYVTGLRFGMPRECPDLLSESRSCRVVRCQYRCDSVLADQHGIDGIERGFIAALPAIV